MFSAHVFGADMPFLDEKRSHLRPPRERLYDSLVAGMFKDMQSHLDRQGAPTPTRLSGDLLTEHLVRPAHPKLLPQTVTGAATAVLWNALTTTMDPLSLGLFEWDRVRRWLEQLTELAATAPEAFEAMVATMRKSAKLAATARALENVDFIGMVFYTPESLKEAGATEHTMYMFRLHHYKWGIKGIEGAIERLGIAHPHVEVESVTVAGTTRDILVVTDLDRDVTWYGLPEVVYTYDHIPTTMAEVDPGFNINFGQMYGNQPAERVVPLGPKLVGISFFKNPVDLEYNLTGSDRLKAVSYLTKMYAALGGSAGIQGLRQGLASLNTSPAPTFKMPKPAATEAPGRFAVSGTAEGGEMEFLTSRTAPAGTRRAQGIAIENGVEIPEGVRFQRVPEGSWAGNVNARYGPSDLSRFEDGHMFTLEEYFGIKSGEPIPVYVKRSVFLSDESIVAHYAHESYEVQRVINLFEKAPGGRVSAFDIRSNVMPGWSTPHWHNEAWDYAQSLVRALRGGQ